MASLPSAEDWHEGNEQDLSIISDCFCPNCQQGNAVTTMLPTKIPMFREIIVMSLHCEDCNFRNTEVSFGGEIQKRGHSITLHVQSSTDLDRQIIKSDSATLGIPQLQFEIPPLTQRGTVSTLEGMLKKAAENLQALQPERLKLGDLQNFYRCKEVIEKLNLAAEGRIGAPKEHFRKDHDHEEEEEKPSFLPPFDVILDDPAGNSFIEARSKKSISQSNDDTNNNNNHKSASVLDDPQIKHHYYYRTPTQDMALGLQPSADAIKDGTIRDTDPKHKNVANVGGGTTHSIDMPSSPHTTTTNNNNDTTPTQDNENENDKDPLGTVGIGRREVLQFPTPCPHCTQPTQTSMCVTDIPHFKECIIMSLLCDACGYKSNEVKGGGGVPRYGTKITLLIKNTEDLAREVLKSDTAGIELPELDLVLEEGGLDGLYTTVEGLLQKLYQRLETVANPFGMGDASKLHHGGGHDPALSKEKFAPQSKEDCAYMEFLQRLKALKEGQRFPFTLIITDPLSNSFVGPIPEDAIALAKQAELEGGKHDCYHAYVDEGMEIEEYERTQDQNDMLGLSDMKTENYQEKQLQQQEQQSLAAGGGGADEQKEYYGTDQMEELPDRLRRVNLDRRGPDHPHLVAKAPVAEDRTVMGPESARFAVPAMEKRGERKNPSLMVVKKEKNHDGEKEELC